MEDSKHPINVSRYYISVHLYISPIKVVIIIIMFIYRGG